MSTFFFLTAARARTLLRGLAARIAADERGQDTIEYIGVLVVVAAIIALVVGLVNGGAIGKEIGDGASSLISKVFHAGG